MNTNPLTVPSVDAPIESHPRTARNGVARTEDQEDAFPRFLSEPLPDDYVESILRLWARVPMESHHPPCQFIVVRDEATKARLSRLSLLPHRLTPPPVLVVTFQLAKVTLNGREGIHREEPSPYPNLSTRSAHQMREGGRSNGSAPLNHGTGEPIPMALTTMRLLAEAFGVTAAPLPRLDPQAAGVLVGLPPEAEMIAVLALGFAEQPSEHPATELPPLPNGIHIERYGRPWSA